MTRAWTQLPEQIEDKPVKRISLIIFGLTLAVPALLGLIRVSGSAFLYETTPLSEAIPLLFLLAIPYAGGLLLFFYALDHFCWAKAIKKTAIVLALTVAAIAVIKLVAAAGLAAGGGGSSSDDSSDGADSDDERTSSDHVWHPGWSTESTGTTSGSSGNSVEPAYGSRGNATLPTRSSTCIGCGRFASADHLGFCVACSPIVGSSGAVFS